MELVVHQLALLFRALDGHELASAHSIPSRDHSRPMQDTRRSHDDLDACLDHDLVDDAWVGLHLEVTLLRDVHEAGEEGFSGHSERGKLKVAIVDRVVAELGADVADFDAGEGFVRL